MESKKEPAMHQEITTAQRRQMEYLEKLLSDKEKPKILLHDFGSGKSDLLRSILGPLDIDSQNGSDKTKTKSV